MSEERLQKVLARAGIASRRAAEQLIAAGRVLVNGKPVRELGTRADPERDRIEVDGRAIARERHVYYLLHKPRAIVTTLHDPEGRPSLGELLQDVGERIYPVGRLDFHTSGALLLTNDGDLAQALLHPSHAVPKTYVAKVSREVDESMMRALESGVTLDDGYKTRGARVMHMRDEEGKSWIEITITEGKNRQIHRMLEALGARVMRLSRISFAGLSTEAMRPGDLRPLSRDEVESLRRQYLPRDLLERSAERGSHARSASDDDEPARQERRSGRAAGTEAKRAGRAEGARQAPHAGRGARGEGVRDGQRTARHEGAREAPGGAREGARTAQRDGRGQGARDGQRGTRVEGAREAQRSGREGAREASRGARVDGAREAQRSGREGARDGRSARGVKEERSRRDARPASTEPASRSTRRQNEKSAPKVDSSRRAGHKTRPT